MKHTKILSLVLILALAGCAKTVPVRPLICPTPEVPKAAHVATPHLPTDDLTKTSTDQDTAKAYSAALKILKNEVQQLREALAPFE